MSGSSEDDFPYIVEVAGDRFRVRAAAPTAIAAFTTAVSPHIKDVRIRNDHIDLFVRTHTHPSDYESLLYRMIDPEDRITKSDLEDLMRAIVLRGTARPTVPSSRWR